MANPVEDRSSQLTTTPINSPMIARYATTLLKDFYDWSFHATGKLMLLVVVM